jgi:DNA polymerase-3 subunit alpha
VDTRACNRKVLESLVKCGAFDSVGEARAQLFASIDVALGRAAGVQQDRARGQVSLFGVFEAEIPQATTRIPTVPEWAASQRLAYEKELLGFYVTGHPLAQHEDILKRYELTPTSKALEMTANQMVRMGGIVTNFALRLTKAEQKQMATLVLEDLEGTIEVLVFPETFGKFGKHLAQDRAIYLCGSINARDEKPKINAQEILPIDEVPKRFTKQIHVRLQAAHTTEGTLLQLSEILARHQGNVPVLLCVLYPLGEIVFLDTHAHYCVAPTPEFMHDVETLLGEDTVIIKPDTTLPQMQRRQFNGGFAREKAA